MNILLIGCGSIGKKHINNLLELEPRSKFYIMRYSNCHDEFTQKIRASIIKDFDEINCELDLVVVANSSAHHRASVQKIIEKNIPAYIEKPLVTTISDLAVIKEAIAKSNYSKPTMMGCNLRFMPSIRALKEQIEKEKIGNICRAIFEVGQYLPEWRPTQDYRQSYSAHNELGGGVINDLVHELDLVRFLLGEFEVVSCQYQHLSHLELNAEDTAVIHLGRKKGPFVSVNLDYISRTPTRSIKIVGDEGTLIWDLFEKKLILRDQSSEHILSDTPDDFNTHNTYKIAMGQLISSIKNNQQTEQPIEEGIRSTELMLSCKELGKKLWQ